MGVYRLSLPFVILYAFKLLLFDYYLIVYECDLWVIVKLVMVAFN